MSAPGVRLSDKKSEIEAPTICGYKDRRGAAPGRAEQAWRRREAASTSCWTCCGPVCGGRAYRWAPGFMMHSFAEALTPKQSILLCMSSDSTLHTGCPRTRGTPESLATAPARPRRALSAIGNASGV